jgi:hypothetical protein
MVPSKERVVVITQYVVIATSVLHPTGSATRVCSANSIDYGSSSAANHGANLGVGSKRVFINDA